MIENQQGQQYENDDLDLITLFEKLFSFFKNYGRRVIIFTIAGMLLGFAMYKLSPRVYESTLLLHSSTLTNTEQINIIENWNALLKGGEYSTLGERLNCQTGTLKKVAKITAAEIQKSYIPNNPNAFVVTVLVKDNSVLDSLSNGMVYGFENNEYIKSKLMTRRANLAALIDKVKIEIGKLDSTKRNIEKNINSNNQHLSSFIIDVSAINGQMIGLNEKLIAYQDELKFAHAVEVYHKFESFKKPVSPKLFKMLVLGFIGGASIGCLSAFYVYLLKRLRAKASG